MGQTQVCRSYILKVLWICLRHFKCSTE